MAYLLGNFVSITGTWAQRVVVFWMAWELSGSTATLGLIAALDLLPSVLAAPVAGSLADRRSPLRLTRNVQLLSVLPPAFLIAAVQFDMVTLPVLMALALATGVLNGLDHPLRLLLVGLIAPREQVPTAVAANSIVFNVGRMLGPAIGGWAASAETPTLVFGYNAVTFLVFVAVLSRLPPMDGENLKEAQSRLLVELVQWGEVVRAFDRSLVIAFTQFAVIAALIRPVFELLPSFADDLAGSSKDAAQIFSLLTSAQGFGAMVGAFSVSWLLAKMPFQSIGMAAAALAILADLLFLFTTSFPLALCALALLSGAILANGIATQVAMQTQLSPTVRGRALSLYTMTFRGLPAAGAVLVGALGDFIPLRSLFAALAIVTLSLSVWAAVAARTSD